MLYIFYKSVVKSSICFAASVGAAASEQRLVETKQTDKEGWLCAGDFCS